MTASASLSYSAYVEKLRAKDPSVLLGSLVWYTVAESVRVPHAKLLEALAEVGLTGAPPEPRDDDVFRRVSTSHQRKRVETDIDGIFENYLVRDVSRDGGVVTKDIVVEQVDSKGRKLDYQAAVRLDFDVKTSKINVASLVSPPASQAMNVAALIKRDFKSERGTVNAYGIREMLRRIVLGTGATIVRPTGGVYFVMEKHRATVDALVALAQRLNGVTFHPVPLINDGEQQAMLREAIENETRATVEKALDEIDRLMETGLTEAKYAELAANMRETQARCSEYAELLDETLSNVDLLTKSYDAKMRKLFLAVNDPTPV